MNKFIRTNEGIYETRENGETCNGFGCKSNNGTIKIHKKDIIEQADTIDELCDEFVYGIDKYNEKPMIAPQNFFETKIKIAKCMKCDLYGAIWTDKGLIYVAKMNEKGDLELI